MPVLAYVAIQIYIAMGYIGFTGGTAMMVANFMASMLVRMAVSALSSMVMQLIGGRPSQQNHVARSGMLVNSSQPNEPLKKIYGELRVGMTRVFVHAGGLANRFLNLALTLGYGRIEGIKEDSYGKCIYLDDKRSSFYESYKGLDLLDYIFHEGSPDQQIGGLINDPDKGNPNHTENYRHISWLEMRLKYNEEAWNKLPEFTAIVRGTKLFDPRTGMVTYYQTTTIKNQANAGATNIDVQSTAEMASGKFIRLWLDNGSLHETTIVSVIDSDTVQIAAGIPSGRYAAVGSPVEFDGPHNVGQNPALVWYDAMTDRLNSIGIPRSLINTQSVIDAANICDANNWRFNGVLMDRRPFGQNIQDILDCFRGAMVWSGGQYHLLVLSYDTPVMSLSESDIGAMPDGFEISGGGLVEIPDRVTVWFSDPNDNYVSKSVPLIISGIAESGSIKETPQEMAFIGITDYAQAVEMGAYHLKRARFSRRFSMPCHPKVASLDPGDIVKVTHSYPGWNEKILRIESMGLAQCGKIPVTFIEEDASIYTGSGITVIQHSPISSSLPSPNMEIDAPLNLSASTGEDEATSKKTDAYIEFSWDNLGPGYDYELQYRKDIETRKTKHTIKDSSPEIPAPTFTGTGSLKMSTDGEYTGDVDRAIRVQIDGTGTPNTFKVSYDGGSTWAATYVAITGDLQNLNYGIKINFNKTTGGTLGDRWDFTVKAVPSRVMYKVGGLPCGQKYYYRLRALGEGKKKSNWAYGPNPITTWQPSTQLASPSGLSLSAKPGKFVLKWTKSSEELAKEYAVYVFTSNAPASAKIIRRIAHPTNQCTLDLGAQTEDASITLASGVTYHFWLTVRDSTPTGNESEKSYFGNASAAKAVKYSGSSLQVEDDTSVTVDHIADGNTYKRVTADEKTGAGYAYTNLDSSGLKSTALVHKTAAQHAVPSSFYLDLRLSCETNTTQMSIEADWLTLHDNSSPWKTVSVGAVSLTNEIDATQTGSEPNKRDQAAKFASQWVHFFVIYKSSDGTKASLSSLSATNPTLPSGYDYFVRVGSCRVNASGKLPSYTQINDRCYLPSSVFSETAPAQANMFESRDISTNVPPTAKAVFGRFGFSSDPTTNQGMSVASSDGGRGITVQGTLIQAGASPYTLKSPIPFEIPIIEQQKLYWRASSTAPRYAIELDGWVDDI